MIRPIALAAAVLLASAPMAYADGHSGVPVPSGAYDLDPTHASIVWRVDHLGLSMYTARFTKFDMDLNLDVEDPSKSSVTATIDPTSIRTDYPGQKDFDGNLASQPNFFNAGDHPQISFESTGVEMTGDETATITGDLTMLGQTLPVTFDAELHGALAKHPFAGGKPAIGFTATGTVDRSAYGMSAVPNIGTEVTVMISAEFIKAD
jgi:polyisoprenoid-binding protein YceI